jgi:hypothetical protein
MSPEQSGQLFGPVWPQGCWPDKVQGLLLKACLFENQEAAQAAFHAWAKNVELYFVDAGSQILLLMLYERLRHWNVEYADFRRIKGVARYFWVRHQTYRRELRDLVETFSRARIEIMLLKGAALNATVYSDGNRLMSDIDVAVRRNRAGEAITLLQDHGWKSQFRCIEQLLSATHGCHFRRSDGHLDLHWDFFHGKPLGDEAQELLWSAAQHVEFDGMKVCTLSATDQFLHTCEHGMRTNETAPFRWLADACLIHRNGGPIDWQRLAMLAEQFELVEPVTRTLRYLELFLGSPIPQEAYTALRSRRRPLTSRIEYFVATRRMPGSHPFWRELPTNLFNFVRARRVTPDLSLADYLIVVNNFEPPLWPNIRQLISLEGAARARALTDVLRRLWDGLRGRAGNVHVSPYADDAWPGFFAPESTNHGTLRWSGTNAGILLPIRAHHRKVVLRLAKVRPWHGDLDRDLVFRLNRQSILPHKIHFNDWTISVDLDPTMLAPHHHHRLEIRCPKWAGAVDDPRELGVPILNVSLLVRAA